MVRSLWELATGENPSADDSSATPRNPQGELGVDRSGPPWGPAPRHTIASAGGRRPGSFSRNNGNSFLLSLSSFSPRQRLAAGTVHSTNPAEVRAATGGWEFWNRPYARTTDRVPPYSRGYIRVSAYLAAAGSVAVTVRGGKHGTQHEDSWRSATFTVASMTPTTFLGGLYIDLEPGLNTVDFEFRHTGNSCFIEWLDIQQIQKLSH